MPTIPPFDEDDVTLVLSAGLDTDAYQTFGRIVAVGDRIVRLGIDGSDFGWVSFVDRVGDDFSFPADGANLATNPPDDPADTVNAMEATVLDGTVAVHRALTGYGPQAGLLDDEMYPLTIDEVLETAAWGDAVGDFAEPTNRFTSRSSPSRIVKLDDDHVAVVGTTSVATGVQPQVFMVDYSGASMATPTGPVSYGPFTFGAKYAEAGGDPRDEQMLLVRVDATRLLAVWLGHTFTDFSVTSNLYHRRLLYAQVLSYDTGGHTVTATGPIRRFNSGLAGGNSWIRQFWYPEGILVLLEPERSSPLYDNQPDDHKHIARSLIVTGFDVTEGHSQVLVASLGDHVNAADYWYDLCAVAVGDRIVVIYNDVGDDGGDLRYAKVRVVTEGTGRGALVVYDDGLLLAGVSTDREIFQHGPQADLSDGAVALFEHYIEDYARNVYRFAFVKPPA